MILIILDPGVCQNQRPGLTEVTISEGVTSHHCRIVWTLSIMNTENMEKITPDPLLIPQAGFRCVQRS